MKGMLEVLLHFERKLLGDSKPGGALVSQPIQEHSQVRIRFITFKSGIKRRITTDTDDLRVDCFALLSFGSLIRIYVLEKVGDISPAYHPLIRHSYAIKNAVCIQGQRYVMV
jgi:hypothetical protein